MTEQEQKKLYAKIIAKAWANEAYKQRLLAEPHAVLAEEGVVIPESVNIHVTEKPQENTDKDMYFTLPAPDEDMTIENVEERIAASEVFFERGGGGYKNKPFS